jgi:hypothetical protein
MVWDYVLPKNHTIPLTVLHTHHRTQRPNMRQQVWIGRYEDDQPHSFWRTAAHSIGPVTGGSNDPQDAHAYLAAITIGQLCLVVFGHLFDQLVPPVVFPEAIVPKLVQIWPPITEIVAWPPASSLDDDALDAVVNSLGLPIPDSPQP